MNGLEYQIALLEDALACLDVRYHSLSDVVVSDLLKTLANTTAVVRRVADEQRRRLQTPGGSLRLLTAPKQDVMPASVSSGGSATTRSSPPSSSSGGDLTHHHHSGQRNPFDDPHSGSESLVSISEQLGIPLHRIRELNPHMAAVGAEEVLTPNTFIKLPREAMRPPLRRERRDSTPRLPPCSQSVASASTTTAPIPPSSPPSAASSSCVSASAHRVRQPPPRRENTFAYIALGHAKATQKAPSPPRVPPPSSAATASPPPARSHVSSRSPSSSQPPRTSSDPLSDRTPTHRATLFLDTEDAEMRALSLEMNNDSDPEGVRGLTARAIGPGAAEPGDSLLWTPASVRSPPPANAPAPLPPPPPYRPHTAVKAATHNTGAGDVVDGHHFDAASEDPVAETKREKTAEGDTKRTSATFVQMTTRGGSPSHQYTHSASTTRRSTSSGTTAPSQTGKHTNTRSGDVADALAPSESPVTLGATRSLCSERTFDPPGAAQRGESVEAAHTGAGSPRHLRDAIDSEMIDDHIVAAAEEEALWSPETVDRTPADRRSDSDSRGRSASVGFSPADWSDASPLPSSSATRRQASQRGAEPTPSATATSRTKTQATESARSPASAVPSTLAYFYQHTSPPALEQPFTTGNTQTQSRPRAAVPSAAASSASVAGDEARPVTSTLTSTRPLRTTSPTSAANLPRHAARALHSRSTASAGTGLSSPSSPSPQRTGSPLHLRNLQPITSSPTRRPTSSTMVPAADTTTTGHAPVGSTSATTATAADSPSLRSGAPIHSVFSISSSSSSPVSAPATEAPVYARTPWGIAVTTSPSQSRSLARTAPGASISPHRSPRSSVSPVATPTTAASIAPLQANWSPVSPEPHPSSFSPSTPPRGAQHAAGTAASASIAASPSPLPSRGFTLPAPEELEEKRSSTSMPAQRMTSEEPGPRTQTLMNASHVDIHGSPAPASAALRPSSHPREEAIEALTAEARDGLEEAKGDDFDTLRTISAAYGVPIEDLLLYNDFLCAYDMDEPLPADLPITLPVVGGEEEEELDV